MEQSAVERGALVCLVLLMIAVVTFAGCTSKEAGETLAEGACEKLSGMDRDHCYQQIAKFNGDGKLCEKIEHPGPKSKCYIYVGDTSGTFYGCIMLPEKSTGDGAYTRADCYQYLAVSWQDPGVCFNMDSTYESWGNDLNSNGVDLRTCLTLASKKCGHIGEPGCISRFSKEKYCIDGQIIGGMCNA